MDHPESLNAVSAHYAVRFGLARPADLSTLADEYRQESITSLLKPAVIALAFDALFSGPKFETNRISRDMLGTWKRAYPDLPPGKLEGQSIESLKTPLHDWKRKLFESELARCLNNGEWIGDLHLKTGQRIKPCISNAWGGWSLKIIGRDNTPPDTLQLKALRLIACVHRALQRYPDTPILAMNDTPTHELATGNCRQIVHAGRLLPDVPSEAKCSESVRAILISSSILSETAKVLAHGQRFEKSSDTQCTASGHAATSPAATPLLESFSAFLDRLISESEAKNRSPEKPASARPGISSSTEYRPLPDELIKAIAVHYPYPETRARACATEAISALEPRPSMVVERTQQTSEIEAKTLKEWIAEAISRSLSGMNEHELKAHLTKLERIKSEQLIDKAFSEVDWLDRILSGSSPAHLSDRLNQAIEDTRCMSGKISG